MPPKYISKFQLKESVWVFVPTTESIQKGKEIKSAIEKNWKAPKNYYHLRKGGHVEALKSHLHHSSFIHLDIQNFFGSINKTRVTRCLKEMFPYSIAREMANCSTVLHPKDKKFILPFGFVQSPILASICLDKSALGVYLRALQKVKELSVSVYVDDIVLSTSDQSLFTKIHSDIKTAAERAGFHLNENKEEGPSDIITAFNIELSNESMMISPQRLNELRDSFQNAETEHKRRGILGYVMSVNQQQQDQILGFQHL